MPLPRLQRPMVFFDLETTGTDLSKDRIVEIALVRVDVDGTQERFQSRVNPEMPIPPGATAVHGIRDEDVRFEPRFRHIAVEVAWRFRGADVSGYNIRRFDVPMLEMEFARAGVSSPFAGARIVDSYELFMKLVSHSLDGAVKFFCGRPHENAHAAMSDVMATMEVLAGQLEKFPELPGDVDALAAFAAPKDADKFVDPLGKLIRNGDGEPAINFGRYKGKSLREMARADADYLRWMLSKDFHPVVVRSIQDVLESAKK